MAQFEKKQLTKKSEDISGWYTDVILKSELADYAPVKGTMVIRPYGFAIWERVQEILNPWMKKAGIKNAYFPLFIPHSLLEKEKEHVKGFSPELAIVTIGGGETLKDPLVVRPTSETIMYEMYAKWVQSWRDLPLLINQWNNVVRWEKRTYLFLRTSEFLWQEGHTAHETEKEDIDMCLMVLEWYRKIYEEYFAMPVVLGTKSDTEKFAGAKTTYTAEALMPDGKALQVGTSHNLGQNFSKPFNIHFQNRMGKNDFAWQTSWAISTRSIGGLVLEHGDDNGLVLPPKLAPTKVVILPILGKEDEKVLKLCQEIKSKIEAYNSVFPGEVQVWTDPTKTVGWKTNDAELRGVPIMIAVGRKEVEENSVGINTRLSSDANRDDVHDDTRKQYVGVEKIGIKVEEMLAFLQNALFEKAKKFLDENTHNVTSYEKFKEVMAGKRGFLKSFWCGGQECEKKIKDETKASTRCLPLNPKVEEGVCIYCQKPAKHRWIFAQSY
jgi:prolyl-tRNA synthetase